MLYDTEAERIKTTDHQYEYFLREYLKNKTMRIKTTNFWKGRAGFSIKAIVLHITDGSEKSAINTFENPDSYVSCHYLIGDNNIYEVVSIHNTAWGCGRVSSPTWKGFLYRKLEGIDHRGIKFQGSERGRQGQIFQPVWDKRLGGFIDIINPNLYTLNVEVVSKGEFPKWSMWIKWAKFIKELADKHNLPLDKLHIVNHREINGGKTCPGNWFCRFYLKILIKYFI